MATAGEEYRRMTGLAGLATGLRMYLKRSKDCRPGSGLRPVDTRQSQSGRQLRSASVSWKNTMSGPAILGAILLALMVPAAFGGGYSLDDLEIIDPWARATPPGAPVSGGYLTIRNSGDEADRLISVSAPFAGRVEIHEMNMDGDVMQMRKVDGGLEVPAGGEIVLEPGGYHIMFMQLGGQLAAQEKYPVTLVFEKAGTIEVDFIVGRIGPGKSGHGD